MARIPFLGVIAALAQLGLARIRAKLTQEGVEKALLLSQHRDLRDKPSSPAYGADGIRGIE